jgi:DNA polymerase III delta prime subunit
LSDSISTHLSAVQALVHAGSGDLNAFLLPVIGGRSPRKQAADDLRWLAQRFVDPGGFGEARDVLRSHRTVLLGGSPGSGKTATAKVLLRELLAESDTIHELLVQDEESETRLNLDHIGDGDLAWLDLSGVSGALWSEIQAELSSLRQAVHEHAAHLAILLPQETEDLRPEFCQYRVKIVPPSAHEVLSRYLRMDGILEPGGLPPLPFLDEHRPLREIQKYAQLIVDARKMASGRDDLAAWCAVAYQALSGQGKSVAQLVTTLSQGQQRSFLFAAAMLHGASAGAVHRASVSLLQVVGHPPEEHPLLERATLDQRLREIRAEIDPSGNVRFASLDYDSAVRSYFWAHMPEIHDHMGTWISRTVDDERLTDTELGGLVERFTEFFLNERYWSALLSLMDEWSRCPTNGRVKAAAVVLQCGLRNEKSGRAFRRKIYEWSRTRGLPDTLASVIVVACRGEMAVSHPDEALVRLHHLARRERGTRARQALAGLVSEDRRFLRQMLNRLTDPNPERKKWAVDVDLFLELAVPEALTVPGPHSYALIRESAIRGQLADGWSLVFANTPLETWRPHARRWLQCAVRDGGYRHELLEVLIEGGKPSADVLARLYTMTRGSEMRTSISDLLLQKVNVAQGVRIT